MKKIFFEILTTTLLLTAAVVSCESLKLGDAGLSKAPESSGATIDTLFASLRDADKVLTSAYYYLPYGLISDFDSKMGRDILESITDHFVSNKHSEGDGPNDLYYTGALGANISGQAAGGEAYRFGSEKDYTAIRYAWLFLENADRIPEDSQGFSAGELAKKKAEAKMCIAVAYANMVRYVGGVPLIKKHIETSDEMSFPRNTFKETIDFIVQMCDEAAADLPWSVTATEDGRFTKAAAIGLKLRILCFAASPTFNSDTPWHPAAGDWEGMGKYVRYGQTYDKGLWDSAKAAADEFMSGLSSGGFYGLVQATPTGVDPMTLAPYCTPRDYRLAYRDAYNKRGTIESIISIRKSNSTSYHNSNMDLQDDFGCGATLDWVNKFPYADGTPFPENFDWAHPAAAGSDRMPFFKSDANGDLTIDGSSYMETRDPRLYENICVPGDNWKNGVVGPNYVNAKGPNFQDGNTGFLQMKFIMQQEADRNTPPHWCLMRFAEVLLNAAEAYNESNGGPDAKAESWLNAVRARVGLPPVATGMSKEDFRKALILERELEFGFEEVRWFDMVRWGLKEAFTAKLRALTVTGNKQKNATSFTYEPKLAFPSRPIWQDSAFDTKWYLAPIPAVEVNKGYGMTQNPGW
ncbi:MAG: RagB/SusD family nutrient uptake outer membrane protein [Bacteroidales bacterium]|nr:RagB/SusD family nutrient uptake outer membrane protein [Bacteroidales bacterium]